MDPLWILTAFILGFIGFRLGLPPMVGYLIAGFVLQTLGVEGGATLEKIADLGVTLLLFSIGLKLQLGSLAKPEIWAGASIHMMVTVIVFGAGTYVLSLAGFSAFGALDFELSLLISFALSFSSTVFAVKVLEERGEMSSLHGRISIGILIMQDVIAVVFLALSSGEFPSLWAIPLLLSLFGIKPIAGRFIRRCGHGELLILFGILMTIIGYRSFELVGLKGDLGALVFGMLLATNPIANELSEKLISFKDLLLVGFFLNIGMAGLPTPAGFAIWRRNEKSGFWQDDRNPESH